MHLKPQVFFASLLFITGALGSPVQNKTFNNPLLPGFHPDPSCIFVPEWDDTFFCATSSFNAFPGIPIFASKDLVHVKQIGETYSFLHYFPVLNFCRKCYKSSNSTTRPRDYQWFHKWNLGTCDQVGLPLFIFVHNFPIIRRYHDGTFYLVTTLVYDHLAADDISRWDNVRPALRQRGHSSLTLPKDNFQNPGSLLR